MTPGLATKRRALPWVYCWAALAACDSVARQSGSAPTREQVGATASAVASVDGDAISVAEVEHLVRATGLGPFAALRRLERERLLAAYAESRGYGQDERASREIRQARVRALLHAEVEQGRAPKDVTAAEVGARFEALRTRDTRPEVRHVIHVLFKLGHGAADGPARAHAEAWLRTLQALPTLDGVAAELSAVPATGERSGLPVVRESLQVTRDSRLEQPFLDAVFALAEPGLAPRITRTTYGLHVMLLREIAAPVVPVRSDYEAGIRKQLSDEKRAAALESLVDELRAAAPPVLDEAFVRRALTDDALLGSQP